MTGPVSRTNCHTRSTNLSRPRSNRVLPSLATSRSTTFWVAIPAWSVPGSHSAARPRMRSKRVWQFVRETGPVILEQLKVIGCSCDWSRTRFTFDEAYSRSVREVFVRLWEEKLIYRGHRVIHWCPHCLTALSDEEAESKDTEGKLYYIRYPVEGGPQPFLTVATTRPETLLGDTAVAVNPKD